MPTWIVVYAGLLATVILTERDRPPGLIQLSPVTPVAAGVSQPAMTQETNSRRSDL